MNFHSQLGAEIVAAVEPRSFDHVTWPCTTRRFCHGDARRIGDHRRGDLSRRRRGQSRRLHRSEARAIEDARPLRFAWQRVMPHSVPHITVEIRDVGTPADS